jgi:hypothetical protein
LEHGTPAAPWCFWRLFETGVFYLPMLYAVLNKNGMFLVKTVYPGFPRRVFRM